MKQNHFPHIEVSGAASALGELLDWQPAMDGELAVGFIESANVWLNSSSFGKHGDQVVQRVPVKFGDRPLGHLHVKPAVIIKPRSDAERPSQPLVDELARLFPSLGFEVGFQMIESVETAEEARAMKRLMA
jgi:hypothetical protein